MNIKVLIFGATGGAGSGVLDACLKHPAVNKVTVITRRGTGIKHAKLAEIIHDDFLNYSKIEDKMAGYDAILWCLGISQSKVSKEDYHRITYDFTLAAAKVLAKLNQGMTFCFLSGSGTNEQSKMMWARVKGKTETDLGKFNFNLYNFRPGFIHPIGGRKSDYMSARILYPFIKKSAKMCVEADELGYAMINAALFGYDKHTLENVDIRALAKRDK